MNTFGEYLRNLREKKGFSLNQLALKSDVSNAHISRIERGIRPAPSPEIIEKLAKALNADYQEMMHAAGYLEDANNQQDRALAKIASALQDNPELLDFWTEISQREDLQLMFKQVRDLSPESIRKIIRVIKAIEDEEAE